MLTTPTWSGIVNKGRAYSPFTLNVEHLVPWRTLSGRQHFYLDHENYLAWGEHLPVYKPRPDHTMLSELERSMAGSQGKLFNYITPHGKWSIHSTYSENLRMMTLSRGGYPVWINHKDAAELGPAGQRLGRAVQRQRRFRTALHPVVTDPTRNGLCLSRHRADRRDPHLTTAQTPGRNQQLAHPGATQAGADERRLCAVHLLLQLLGTDRRQPGHLRPIVRRIDKPEF